MNEKKRKRVTALFLASLLPLGIAGYWVYTNYEDTYLVSRNIQELSIPELWQSTLQKTGIENSSAHFKGGRMRVNETGIITVFHFSFCAKRNGREVIGYVSITTKGTLNIGTDPIDYTNFSEGHFTTVHPYVFLTELRASKVLSKDTHIRSGAISHSGSGDQYTYNYSDIYALKDGRQLPLESITFDHGLFITPIYDEYDSKGVLAYFLWYDVQRATSKKLANSTV